MLTKYCRFEAYKQESEHYLIAIVLKIWNFKINSIPDDTLRENSLYTDGFFKHDGYFAMI